MREQHRQGVVDTRIGIDDHLPRIGLALPGVG
jgi:hypothetical protein